MNKKRKIIIVSSPSGAGKTTICKKILKKNKKIKLSVSYTTRLKRKAEREGVNYFFVTKKRFLNLKKKNFFLETAKVFGNFYGSPKKNVHEAFKNSKMILFDIDWQGAQKIRKKYLNSEIIDFFILPPSIAELKSRLLKRGRESKKEINKRLSLAVKEIGHYNEYKYILINQNIEKTVNEIIKTIKKEQNIKKLINKLNL